MACTRVRHSGSDCAGAAFTMTVQTLPVGAVLVTANGYVVRCRIHPAEVPIHGSRFPVAVSTVGVRFLGPPAPAGELRLPHGRPTGGRSAGPQRGCHVAHEQDSTGQGAPFTPGTVVRSRPATILRPAPAASQRPVPTAPLTHPIGGGHLHEASSRVHSRSPITPRWLAAAPEPGSVTASRRSSPRLHDPGWNEQPLRLRPRASHPAVTRGARRGGDRPFAHWPEYYTFDISRTSTVPPTSTHAPSLRT